MQSVQVFNALATSIPVNGLGFVATNSRKDGYITQSLFDATFYDYKNRAAMRGMVIRDAAGLYTPTGYALHTAVSTIALATRTAVCTTAGNYVLTLRAASAYDAGTEIFFFHDGGGANTATITRAGSDTINGGTTLTLTDAVKVRRLVTDGVSAWTTF